jgi:hypothetical protein
MSVENKYWRWAEVQEHFGIELDPDIEVIYYETYWDYSWSDALVIYEENDRVYYNEGDDWIPFPTTMEDAIQMMIDFEKSL